MLSTHSNKFQLIETLSHANDQIAYIHADVSTSEHYIRSVLYQLGVSENYKGFSFSVCAAELALEEPLRMLSVTKNIYPEVAKRFQTSASCVERNIRTLSCIVWERNPKLLQKFARRNLNTHLTASQFISVIASMVPEQM